MNAMDTILNRLRDLPILNIEAFRLIKYCSSPQPSMVTLEGMIKNNPNIVGQIMRLANSPTLVRFNRTETIIDALVLLGFDRLKEIFSQSFYGSLGQILKTQTRELQHGRECGQLSEYIALKAGVKKEEASRIYTCGLLHDIGQLFLAFAYPAQFEKMKSMCRMQRMKLYDSEAKVFGATHTDVGATICSRWNFPDYLIEAIQTHHREGAAGLPENVIPIFCANGYLNQRDGMGFHPWEEKLTAFFADRDKEVPWSNAKAEFKAFLDKG